MMTRRRLPAKVLPALLVGVLLFSGCADDSSIHVDESVYMIPLGVLFFLLAHSV